MANMDLGIFLFDSFFCAHFLEDSCEDSLDGELNVLRILGKYRDYKSTNGQRSQTQVMILLACAVVSPLYSRKHTAQKNSCFPTFCQKDPQEHQKVGHLHCLPEI